MDHGISIPYCYLKKFSKEDRKAIAIYLRLLTRFQSTFIHASLDSRTCRKAGMSSRQLRRYIGKLTAYESPNLPWLIHRLDTIDWDKLVPGPKTPNNQLIANGIRTGWELIPLPVLLKRLGDIHGSKGSGWKNTLWIDRTMNVVQIEREIRFKEKENLHKQALRERQRRHDRRTMVGNNREADSERLNQYQQHPELLRLGPVAVNHQVAMPSKAYSGKLRCSRSTFFRDLKRNEEAGWEERTRRRIRLSSEQVGMNPVAFHRKWGIMPFNTGGLWWGQASNLYSMLRDYSGRSETLTALVK